MIFRVFAILLIIFSNVVCADGVVVDKVYHPYVLPNEKEFEWRLMSRQQDGASLLGQRIAYGQSVSDSVMVEGYLVGEKTKVEEFSLQAYEVEICGCYQSKGSFGQIGVCSLK